MPTMNVVLKFGITRRLERLANRLIDVIPGNLSQDDLDYLAEGERVAQNLAMQADEVNDK